MNESVLKENLSLAISAYINRVSGCETTIQLYRGADATTSEQIKIRKKLLTFLKGTRAAKEKLKQDDPEMYANFQFVWDIRQRHKINELPSPQYMFFLSVASRKIANIQSVRRVSQLLFFRGTKEGQLSQISLFPLQM